MLVNEKVFCLVLFIGVVAIVLGGCSPVNNEEQTIESGSQVDVQEKQKMDSMIFDMMMIQEAVKNKSKEYHGNPQATHLVGTDLFDSPQILVRNGESTIYQEGYFLITPDDLLELAPNVNLKDEYYIVNYDTFEIVSPKGIRYQDSKYHILEELQSLK